MKQTVLAFCLAALCLSSMANDRKDASNNARPKWGFLGDDDSLLDTIKDHDEAILGCVHRVEFVDIKGGFATVHLHVTVARTFKGKLKPYDRIIVEFPIDDVPTEAAARDKMLHALRDNDTGNLRFCFIQRPKGTEVHYRSEWLFVPKFSSEMNDFMDAYRLRSNPK